MTIPLTKQQGEAVSPESLVASARDLIPLIKAHAQEGEDNTCVPSVVVDAMNEAGLFRVLQPKAYGGYEMHPQVFYDVQMALAEADMSTAWIYGVIAIHNFQIALFDPQAMEDVWATDTSVLISSSYQPVGKVERVEGGFNLSGQWGFSSGCDHCEWVFLGAMIPPLNDGDPPDMRTFMLPRSDYEILDTWHVMGLKATGSKDIVVKGAFVPEYRTHKAADGFAVTNPGNTGDEAPIYRIPWAQLFTRAVSTSTIGATQGALDEFLGIMAKKVSSNTGKASRDDPPALEAAALAMQVIDELKLVLERDMNYIMDCVDNGREIPLSERIKFRHNSSLVPSRCIEALDAMITECGGKGIYLANPIVRRFLDAHAGRAHVANQPYRYAHNLAGTHMGQPNQDFFV